MYVLLPPTVVPGGQDGGGGHVPGVVPYATMYVLLPDTPHCGAGVHVTGFSPYATMYVPLPETAHSGGVGQPYATMYVLLPETGAQVVVVVCAEMESVSNGVPATVEGYTRRLGLPGPIGSAHAAMTMTHAATRFIPLIRTHLMRIRLDTPLTVRAMPGQRSTVHCDLGCSKENVASAHSASPRTNGDPLLSSNHRSRLLRARHCFPLKSMTLAPNRSRVPPPERDGGRAGGTTEHRLRQ
jgi:hypothetical protein